MVRSTFLSLYAFAIRIDPDLGSFIEANRGQNP